MFTFLIQPFLDYDYWRPSGKQVKSIDSSSVYRNKTSSFNQKMNQEISVVLLGPIQGESSRYFWPTLSISILLVETILPPTENSNTGGLIGFSSINSATLSINSSYFKGNITSTSKEDNVSCIGGFSRLSHERYNRQKLCKWEY